MAWELYLVRHAIAAERGPEWPDDTKRPLTERGVQRFKTSVDGLTWLGVELDEILSSPLVRAKQTAEFLSAGLPAKPPVRICAALAPGRPPAQAMQQVARDAKGSRLALVGHEPDLGELAAYLIGAKQPLPFKKGGVCRIDVESLTSRAGTLVWFATPKMLRGLAR